MKSLQTAFPFRWVATVFALLASSSISTGESAPGRLLYAADDDWDWASPSGAKELSGLSRYGKMSWSGLDWVEEGLEEVRGVLFGSPPSDLADPELKGLSEMRGERVSYEVQAPSDGGIEKLLQQKPRPNVIILAQNKGADVVDLADEDAASLLKFVEAGGRLLVLDDWRRYVALLDSAVGSALENSPKLEEPARDEAAKLDPVRVKALVAKLADDQFAVREMAKAELVKMGPGIFDHIDAEKIGEPDLRAHINQIRAALFPKKPSPVPPENTNNYRDYMREIERMTKVSEKLKAARIQHRVDEVLVNGRSWPLPALRLTFDPK